MKKRKSRRKIGNQQQSAQQWRLRLEDLEARTMLAGDIVLGPGTQEPRVSIPAEIRIDETERATDPRSIRITNNNFANAERIALGFDAGEFKAIDIRGELIEPSTIGVGISSEVPRPNVQPPIVPVEDSSILLANRVVQSGSPVAITGNIGDSPGGFTDGDYYELEDLAPGETVTAHLATGGQLALVFYDELGQVLRTSNAVNPSVSGDSFISYTIEEAGDFYFAVVPYTGDNATFVPPLNPFDEATVQPGGGGDYVLTIGVDAVDVDFYAIDLNPGDILGLDAIGSANELTIYTPDQRLRVQSGAQLNRFGNYPASSPLPTGGTSSVAYVADVVGRHYVAVEGFNWSKYLLKMRLFRPVIESAPEGQRQILFLDFNGAEFISEIFPGEAPRLIELSPLRDFLSSWDLRSESQLIDAIIKVVDRDLNGDLQEINPDAGVTILNSRDHADPFGQAYVTRVIVGGTVNQAGINTIGIAESVDVGNFDMEETAIVLLDALSAPFSVTPDSLNRFQLAPGASKADLVAAGVGGTISHEAGHLFGGFHTDRDNEVRSVMDEGGNLFNDRFFNGVGDDGIFGTVDDIDIRFEDDEFSHDDLLEYGQVGIHNVAHMFANVLVSGKGSSTSPGGTKEFSGTVFNDVNGNGVRDTGEGGLAGVRAYVDVNNDREFGIAEPSDLTDAAGHFVIPNASVTGDLMIRVATSPGQQLTSPTSGGFPLNGKDPLIFGVRSLTGIEGGVDYNDGPASYGTASHQIQAGISLGVLIDGETGPTENDGISDDGVTISALVAGQTGTATIRATANGFSPGVVNGWVDFNRDGTYDASERVVADRQIEGSQTISFVVPADASPGTSWARFRFGYNRGIGPASVGGVGEVEDYAVQISGRDGGGGNMNFGPDAMNDIVSVMENASNVTLNVLSNDDPGSAAISITAVGASTQGGRVSIAANGLSLIYTPATDFFGTDTFTYTVSNSFGSDQATVTVNVQQETNGGSGEDLVRFRLDTVDVNGTSISTIDSGADFFLNVYTDDLREGGAGVYAAYLDIEFDENLASPNGLVQFDDGFPAGRTPAGGVIGDVMGQFDEYGAFAGFTTEIGDAEQLLLTIPMTAGTDGVLVFTSNEADIVPRHEILLLDISQPIPPTRIDYGSTTITVGTGGEAALTNPANRFDVNNDGFVTARDALALINSINSDGARSLVGTSAAISGGLFYDVSGDKNLSAIDVLQVINFINAEAAAEPNQAANDAAVAAAVDAVFDVDGDNEEEDFFQVA